MNLLFLLLAPCVFLLSLSFPLSHGASTTVNSSQFKMYSGDGKSLVLGGETYTIGAKEDLSKVVWLWGDLEIQGKVERLVVVSGKVRFLPGSQLGKSLVVVSGRFEIEAGADVDTKKVEWKPNDLSWKTLLSALQIFSLFDWGTTVKWAAIVVWNFLLLIFGAIFLGMFPSFRKRTELLLANPWNLLWGWVGICCGIGGVLLLFISIVGIVFLPFYLMLFSFCAFVAYFVAASWMGHRLLFWRNVNKFSIISYLVGLACLQLIWSVESAITPWILTIVWSISFGALVRSVFALKGQRK